MNKAEVKSAIEELIGETLSPIMFEAEGNNLVFYLEDNGQVVESIDKVGRRIRLPSTKEKIYITTNRSPPPTRPLTTEQLQIVKDVMSSRCSVELSRLDLRNFHNDKSKCDAVFNFFAF